MDDAFHDETTVSEVKYSMDASRRSRMTVYRILIVVALGIGFGKIVGVDSVPDRVVQNYRMQQIPKTLEAKAKELAKKDVPSDRIEAELKKTYIALYAEANKTRPTLCANDRSRWSTIRALVEPNARVYRYVPIWDEAKRESRVLELNREEPNSLPVSFKYYPNEILRNCASPCPERFEKEHCVGNRYHKEWVPYAIDKVWETPGWDSIDVVKHGLKDEVYDPENPASGYLYSSKPTLLPTVMAAPYWVLYNVFGLSLAERPFETVKILLIFYNLIPLGIAFLCLASLIDSLGLTDWGRYFALAVALFASFVLTFVATLNNHLPGFVSISIALWAAMKILREGSTKARYFLLAGFFGAFAVACELPAIAFAGLLCLTLLILRPQKTLAFSIPAGLIVVAAFLATDYIAHQSIVPAYAHKRNHMAMTQEASTGADPASFSKNDWYYYNYYLPGKTREAKNVRLSHWANRTGIDKGEPSIARYAFHSTIGARGVFSLAPVWILGVVGFLVALFGVRKIDSRGLKTLGVLGITLTIFFFIFFMTRDQGDRNYGGVSCYPRWFFPLAPLFVLGLVPIADRLANSRVGRSVAYLALFWSVASAAFPTWTPWTSPWLYQFAVDWNLMTPY